jgi:hypothetical protein
LGFKEDSDFFVKQAGRSRKFVKGWNVYLKTREECASVERHLSLFKQYRGRLHARYDTRLRHQKPEAMMRQLSKSFPGY